MPGCSALIVSSAACTPASTLTSLEPRVRDIENATTSPPSSNAASVGSAAASVTVARVDNRTARPSGKAME
ncbi:hypothetical protein D3C71_1134730 [compost metagenome]